MHAFPLFCLSGSSMFPSSPKRSFCLSRLRFSLSDLCTFFGAFFSHLLFWIGLSNVRYQR
uniref:Uncharacterized protein n=1 Tax=Zea mays TaxID=4577 RepID=C4IYA4_MAIZE|nr:unknown [Zea mays]